MKLMTKIKINLNKFIKKPQEKNMVRKFLLFYLSVYD